MEHISGEVLGFLWPCARGRVQPGYFSKFQQDTLFFIFYRCVGRNTWCLYRAYIA